MKKIGLELLEEAASEVTVEEMKPSRKEGRNSLAICVEAAVDSDYYAADLERMNIKYFLKYFYFSFLLPKALEMLRSGELCG
jgi:hypothetical protein